MAIELATAYVSLVPETSKMEAGLKDALSNLGKTAVEAGRKAGKDFSTEANKTAKITPKADEAGSRKAAAVAGKAYSEEFRKHSKAKPDVDPDTSNVKKKGRKSGEDFVSEFSKAAKSGAGALDELEGKLKSFPALQGPLEGVLGNMSSALEKIGGIGDNSTIKSIRSVIETVKFLPNLASEMSSAFSPLTTTISNLGPKLSAMRTGISDVGAAFGTMKTYIAQANPSMSTFQVNMSAVKRTAGELVQVGKTGLKSFFGGLIEGMGGPLNIALMGASALISDITSKNAEADAAMRGYAAAAQQVADAQNAVNDALLASQGLMDSGAKAAVGQRLQAVKDQLSAESQSSASWLDQFRDSSGSLAGGFRSQIFNFGGANEQNNLAFAKDIKADTAKQAGEAIDKLKLSQKALAEQVTGDQPVFDALVASLEKQGLGGTVAAEKLKQVREEILGAKEAGATASPVLTKLGDDVVQSAADIRTAFSALPNNVPIKIDAPGGQAVFELLKELGVQVSTNNDKQITVDAPMAPEVLKMLEALGFQVTTNNDKTITVTQVGAEAAGAAIDAVANRDYTATIRVLTDTSAAAIGAGAALGAGVDNPQLPPEYRPQRLYGAIAMENGGLREIPKPGSAGIYDGRGAGTIFAEQGTGGEAYIPLAPDKRERSTQILAEVARRFGFSLTSTGFATSSDNLAALAGAPDGVKVDATIYVKQVGAREAADQIDAAARNRTTSLSSPFGPNFYNMLPASKAADQALLSQVPTGGTYDASGDLIKGLADCSSGIEDLVNLIDGVPTAGRSMSTGNAAEWLTSRGFAPTNAPVPGAFNVGYNSHHMEGTLAGGTNVNYGSAASIASGGTAGAVGAWGDPSFTQHYYRYDTGGLLPPGMTMVQNATGQNELVLNPEQQQALADAGIDPQALANGTQHVGSGDTPGPNAFQQAQQQTQDPQSPDQPKSFLENLMTNVEGFKPSGGGGKAGTSSLAKIVSSGASVASGLIDTGASLANMAVSGAIAMGTMGTGSVGAAQAGSMAAGFGINMAAAEGKRIAQFWLGDLPGIAADALVAQMPLASLFGPPRWAGYDYTTLAPQLGIQEAASTTIQQMGQKAINDWTNQRKQQNQVTQNPQPNSPGVPAPASGPGAPVTANPDPNGGPAAATVMAPPPPTPPPMAPVTPPDQIPNLYGFDQGGWLQPGQVGINMTGRPEPVLTPKQWEALSSVTPKGSDGPMVKIDAIYGMSPEDVAAQIEQKQRLAAMRYGGRP